MCIIRVEGMVSKYCHHFPCIPSIMPGLARVYIHLLLIYSTLKYNLHSFTQLAVIMKKANNIH